MRPPFASHTHTLAAPSCTQAEEDAELARQAEENTQRRLRAVETSANKVLYENTDLSKRLSEVQSEMER